MDIGKDKASIKPELCIENEEKVKEGENLTVTKIKILSEKADNSVCEIIKENGYGSGFICKIRYDKEEIYCLITNNHVITREMIICKDNIEIRVNNEIKRISLNGNRRIWTDEEIDFTCIEIKKEDKIMEKENMFEIDKNNYNKEYDIEEYDKRGIVIPSIGVTKEIELPQGVIYYIEKNKEMFWHNCKIEPEFSGGVIIILIRNLKIIGIHKGYDKKNKKNVGIYIKEIINNIKEEKEIYGNRIEYIVDIKEKGKEVIIFQENKENEKEIKDNVIVCVENKRIDIKKDEGKYKYKFSKEGKYNIKINFKNNISNLNGFFEECNEIEYLDLSNFNTSKVTDMAGMFNKCNKLKEIKGINKFKTDNVTNMRGMFQKK